MATLTLVIVFGLVVLYGCVSATINVSSGTGRHDLGPEKEQSFKTSKDSQQSTDQINELSSRISGIDKSNQEINRQIDKSSQLQQQQLKRDETIDKLNPRLKRDKRKELYKDKK